MNRTSKRLDRTGPRIPFANPGFSKLQLQSVINALNRETVRRPKALRGTCVEWQEVDVRERQLEIRHLVAMWEAADRNLLKLFKRNIDLQMTCSYGKTTLIPSRDGAAQLAWWPDLQGRNLTVQKSEALNLFIWLLLNPLSRFLAGPCKRCGNYYKKNDLRQKTYCSRNCGKATTAAARTKKRRDDEYQKKLAPAQLAVRKWEKNPRGMDWKEFVIEETGLDPRFITQAVTREKLIPPFALSSTLKRTLQISLPDSP